MSDNYKYPVSIDDGDDIYSIPEFIQMVKEGYFIDYDGYGLPVKDGKEDGTIFIYPSQLHKIPSDADSICWYNR